MNLNFGRTLLLCASGVIIALANQLQAQETTAFTYQGQLHDNGTNANGIYTMIFALYDSVSAGNQIGSSVTMSPTLRNGLFTVNLDFGPGAFNGFARWLDITVSNGPDTQELSPRVQVLSTPYAQFATTAGTVSSSVETMLGTNSPGGASSFGNLVSATGGQAGQVNFIYGTNNDLYGVFIGKTPSNPKPQRQSRCNVSDSEMYDDLELLV